MLSLKLLFCFYLIQSYVCFQLEINKLNLNGENFVEETTTTGTTPTDKDDKQCPQGKSLHSVKDIKVMITYFYNQLSIDEKLSEVYKSQTAAVRDNYIQNLKQFIEWIRHQPEHLKHVLEGLSQMRIKQIEPNVKKIANLLNNFSHLEEVFNDKNKKFNKLLSRQKRFETMCSFNCGEMEDHYIFKREVSEDYYCSSIEELHDKIINKLNEAIEQLKNKILNQLSTDSDKYKENIDEITNNVKDKALQEFGRTMYDVLILDDEYRHFGDDLNITTIETVIHSVQELYIQLDDKLLQMHKAVEKYGQHCKSCADVSFRRNTRNTHLDGIIEISENIVDTLIDTKFNETVVEIKNDWDKIFKDLNELIQKVKEECTNIANFKPIKQEIVKMTNEERQILEKLKNTVPQSGIKNLLNLMKKSQNLLRNVDETITHIESLV